MVDLASRNADQLSEQAGPEGLEVADAESTGLRFGDYVLEEEIAHGGMGVVYRARQISLDRVVAVKLLLLGRYSSNESVERFKREAQSAAALRHPNIVAIHEVGECAGQYFFSMEYIEGRSLADLLRDGPLPSIRAAEFARDLARAMHYAHQQGVLHRDLKPSNVLIDGLGQIRITDFGLAKRLDGSSDLTLTGQMVGTPNYLSPEQAAGRQQEVGPASDVYAIGALLYELLTGRPPFLAQSLQETLILIRDTDPVTPRALNPAVALDLETICLKCLQRRANQRYASAQELADDLDRYLDQKPIVARPITAIERLFKWIRRSPRIAFMVGVTVLAVVSFIVSQSVMSWRLARANRTIQQANVQLAETVRDLEWQKAEDLAGAGKTADALAYFNRFLRADLMDDVVASRILSTLDLHNFGLPVSEPLRHGGAVVRAMFNPAGDQVFTASADGTARLWEASSGRPLLVVTNGSPVLDAALVAQGTRFVTLQSGEAILREAPSGRELRRLSSSPVFGALMTVSSDGARFAFSDGLQVNVVDAQSGESVCPPLAISHPICRAQFSPDGRSLVTSTLQEEVAVWDLASGRHRFAPWPLERATPAFSPDGTRIAVIPADEHLHVFDAVTGARLNRSKAKVRDALTIRFLDAGRSILTIPWNGPVFRWGADSLEQIGDPFAALDWVSNIDVSAEGRYLLTGSRQGVVRLWDLTTGAAVCEPLEHEGPVSSIRFNADGSRVVTASADGTARVWDLRMRSAATPLIRMSKQVSAASFSPDGKRLLTASRVEVQLRDAQTLQPIGEPIRGDGFFGVGFSPDGERIYTSSLFREVRLWDGHTAAPLGGPMVHAREVFQCAFTADGRSLITTCRDAQARVWNTETGELRLPPIAHPNEVINVAVAPDNDRFITGCHDGAARIWSATSGELLVPPIRHKGLLWAVAFSPDGERVLTGSADRTAQVWNSRSGQPVGVAMRHDKAVFHAAFSPDGRFVLTSSEDGTARVWDAASGRAVSHWMRHRAPIWSARYSPDGRLVATASNDGSARIWDARSGFPVSEPLTHPGEVHRVNFSSDSRRLITGSSDGTIQLWEVRLPPVPVPSWFLEVSDTLAGKHLGAMGEINLVAHAPFQVLRERLTAGSEKDFYSRWGRWFFHERLEDPVRPFPR
jgi:WD40 repeat protein/serine/threonine protein kinase